MLTRRSAVAGLVASATIPAPLWAQEWPGKPITLVHGFGAGGNADSIARVMANALSTELGQQIVVEAKSGAGGNIASEQVARAEPDGYRIILLTGGHAVSAALYKNLRFNPVDDFAFLSLVATFPFVIATHLQSPVKSIGELIAAAKKDPGKFTFSSVGVGSTQHLTGELFAEMAGIKLTHVPYRGGMEPLSDLMGGRIDLMVDTITVTGEAIRSGTIRGLGITSRTPWPGLSEVTPIAATLPGFEVRSWNGMAAPAATPPAVVTRLNAAIEKSLQLPKVREQLGFLGVQPEASTPEAMRSFVASEIARWKGVVDKAGIQKI
ncbi:MULTISPECIES: tripartite tricarboxylate transporter substrate binding protein [unclassified Beijerinckia]|uniref:Bug family tripartite tricarboxylate transporter substrate binding protein n=1 Tax=unclassified Beijerinckia TaxID=2638183 RepID=UPI00089AEEC0|nr:MULTISPECIES: tripartite tricarboxylate transporter substrate binding protein [unclassified Beijerinckia]MDH7795831.1 tripartite-type tricarboxylate transporter receptor subunit TctC [Beijerinckia sp. GAS462]SEC18254.1 Tripartite-type tricarboxylate transporter, receptor component TctC [Beijerinckia sp. 28-YEA-48]